MKQIMPEIVRMVHNAFSDVPRPEYTLAQSCVDDDWSNESSRFVEVDQHWWEIPTWQIEKATAAFCFMPVESVPYYLPAYILWACHRFPDWQSGSIDELVSLLGGGRDFSRVAPLLSRAQLAAIATFVNAMATWEEQALRREFPDVSDEGLHQMGSWMTARDAIWSHYL